MERALDTAPDVLATDTSSARKGEKLSLAGALKNFWSHPNAWIIGSAMAAAWIGRIFVGGWTLWDLGLMALILLLWPVQEWLIHVFILHMKPVKIGGKHFDMYVSRSHRAHHADPADMTHVFIPRRSLLIALPAGIVLWLVLMPTLQLGLSGLAFYLTLALTYEWTHYLVHTNYRAKSAFYRRLWQSHRLHHFKNENYWYGVSMLSGDRLLGTQPDHRQVETSSTCRTLGLDDPFKD
jgi:hypothetical protein